MIEPLTAEQVAEMRKDLAFANDEEMYVFTLVQGRKLCDTIDALRAEIERLKAERFAVREFGSTQKKCGHDVYWVTAYGNCMACKVVKLEAALAGVHYEHNPTVCDDGPPGPGLSRS